MNSKDEIVEEVRAAREAYAPRFDYDLAEMFNDLKAKERAGNRNIAALQPWNPSRTPQFQAKRVPVFAGITSWDDRDLKS
jgi:hypothetical protein